MPTSRQEPFTGVIGQNVYVIGGADSTGTILNVNEVYNTATNSWTTAAPMPTARLGGTAAAVNNVLYVMGGGTQGGGNTVNTVEVYDPATDTWSTKTPMPIAENSTSSVVENNIIYVVGGFNNSERLNTVLAYNPIATMDAYNAASNSWTSGLPQMPNAVVGPGSAGVGGSLYCFGGRAADHGHGRERHKCDLQRHRQPGSTGAGRATIV